MLYDAINFQKVFKNKQDWYFVDPKWIKRCPWFLPFDRNYRAFASDSICKEPSWFIIQKRTVRFDYIHKKTRVSSWGLETEETATGNFPKGGVLRFAYWDVPKKLLSSIWFWYVLIMNYSILKTSTDVFTHFSSWYHRISYVYIYIQWQISSVLQHCMILSGHLTYMYPCRESNICFFCWFLSSAPAGCCAFLNNFPSKKQTGGLNVSMWWNRCCLRGRAMSICWKGQVAFWCEVALRQS